MPRLQSKRAAPGPGRPRFATPRPTKTALQLDTTASPPTAILIQPEAFGCGFDVIAPDKSLSREWPAAILARKYAADLASAHGWSIVDQVPS